MSSIIKGIIEETSSTGMGGGSAGIGGGSGLGIDKSPIEKIIEKPFGIDESDISGLLAASKLNRSFLITAKTAEGETKTFRVNAQSERVAKEKFSRHYDKAMILDVKEENVDEHIGSPGGMGQAYRKFTPKTSEVNEVFPNIGSGSGSYNFKGPYVTLSDVQNAYNEIFNTEPNTSERKKAISKYQKTRKKYFLQKTQDLGEGYQNDESNIGYRYDSGSGRVAQRMIPNSEETAARREGWREFPDDALRAAGIIRSKFDNKKWIKKVEGKWVQVYPFGKPEGVEESYHNNIMHAWNSGMEDEEIIKRFGKSEFDRLKQKYGEKSIPVPTLVGYTPSKEITDPLRRRHYGLDGPGKQLRDIIKAEKEKREQGVAEGSEERSQNRLWQMISDYEQRAKATKNDIKKQHYLQMASKLRRQLNTSDEQGVSEADKHSMLGKIQRHQELKKKVDTSFADIGRAQQAGDHPAASKAFRKHERYANLERPGTWTKVDEQGVAEGINDWEEVDRIYSTKGDELAAVLQHINGTYGYYDARRDNLETGFRTAKEARQAFIDYHNAKRSAAAMSAIHVSEGSEWETRHDEFVTAGDRATPEQINKIVSALGIAAKQASGKRGFLNQIVGNQSNSDLARMAHSAETLAKNIQRNSNAKPGTDERKELGQHLVYAVSLLKRMRGEQGVAEGADDSVQYFVDFNQWEKTANKVYPNANVKYTPTTVMYINSNGKVFAKWKKDPFTKSNHGYVNTQGSELTENAENLHINDRVYITGNVRFQGERGNIESFGRFKSFVVVHLDNYGSHSFHSSDVSYLDDEVEYQEESSIMKGLKR